MSQSLKQVPVPPLLVMTWRDAVTNRTVPLSSQEVTYQPSLYVDPLPIFVPLTLQASYTNVVC